MLRQICTFSGQENRHKTLGRTFRHHVDDSRKMAIALLSLPVSLFNNRVVLKAYYSLKESKNPRYKQKRNGLQQNITDITGVLPPKYALFFAYLHFFIRAWS